jgi:predicted MFS family arabinose efflux permease
MCITRLLLWGIAGFILSPALQARVVSAAACPRTGDCAAGHVKWEDRATTDPDRIRRAWSAGAFNVGIATGSLLGSIVVAAAGLSVTPLVAAGLAGLAIVPAMLGSRRATVSSPEGGTPATVALVLVPTE